MNKCPVSVLKAHSLGDIFAPVLTSLRYQLRNSAGDRLIGFRGNPYNFKSLENAQTWLCSNLARFDNAEDATSFDHILKLHKIFAETQAPEVLAEIEAISSYERGEWVITLCKELQIVYLPFGDIDGGNAFTTY